MGFSIDKVLRSCFQYLGIPLTAIGLLYGYLWFKNLRKAADLSGKVVLITGASSGVGEALAHCFYDQRCKVILAARRESELIRVKNDLTDKNKVGAPEPLVVSLDLADTKSCDRALKKVTEIYGHVDILINNGGISCRGNVTETDLDVYSKLMHVNFFGPVYLSRALLPGMIERRSGHILFVSSVQGLIAIPHRSAYAASKYACQAFADTLRAEIHQHNVNVSVISPGYIKTALSINALTGAGKKYGVMDSTTAAGYTPDYVAKQILHMIQYQEDDMVLAPFTHRTAVIIRCLMPSIYFWIMAKRAVKEDKVK